MKKIAIPTRGNCVDDHFGHCEYYTIYTLSDKDETISKETLPSPQGCGCKSNIADTLQEMGITVMLAGNMGPGALNVLSSHGIEVIRGCSGNIDQVLDSFVKGKLEDSGESCHHHDKGGHHCHNH